MALALLIIIASFIIGAVFAGLTEEESEYTIDLTDDEAEEYRKRLIEREEKDVELDKED